MTKLSQLVSIEKSVKSSAERAFTNVYHTIQKAPLLSGISRSYQPKDDDGDRLPPESTLVQIKIESLLGELTTSLTRMYDVILTKETANTEARADVKIHELVIAPQVPVTYLLFLEKQLVDLRTFISKLPTLDPSDEWTYDAAVGVWANAPTETVRTKKIPRNWVKAEATDKHPAQVEVYHEDVIVGYWTTRRFSGAIPIERRDELIQRVERLAEAVKFAREEANSREITDQHAGAGIFGYLFAR